MPQFIVQPYTELRLGDLLNQALLDTNWTIFNAAIAFVKYSGVKHIEQNLHDFSQRGSVKISVGVDACGTSKEGLDRLLAALGDTSEAWVVHNNSPSTFHPKLYLFKNPTNAMLIIGSGNMTEGGLYTNYETLLRLNLCSSRVSDQQLLSEIEHFLGLWSTPTEGFCLRLTEELIQQLISDGLVKSESEQLTREPNEPGITASKTSGMYLLSSSAFKWLPVTPAPCIPNQRNNLMKELFTEAIYSVNNFSSDSNGQQIFLMTLQKTDISVGQRTAGTSRRSPEIFIPLAARNANPDFWGWPSLFNEDPSKANKCDRVGVKMLIGTEVVDVNMMTWPDKSDFRLRSERLRSAGQIGDILVIEKIEGANYSYYVEIIPKHSLKYQSYLKKCSTPVHNSRKTWAYI